MNKEEILTKSRAENKNQDMVEKEAVTLGASLGTILMVVLAGVFMIVQISVGGGMNYGLYALVLCGYMGQYWMKWWKLRRGFDLFLALLHMTFILALSAAHIWNLLEFGI